MQRRLAPLATSAAHLQSRHTQFSRLRPKDSGEFVGRRHRPVRLRFQVKVREVQGGDEEGELLGESGPFVDQLRAGIDQWSKA